MEIFSVEKDVIYFIGSRKIQVAAKKSGKNPCPINRQSWSIYKNGNLMICPKRSTPWNPDNKELYEAMSDPLFFKNSKEEIARGKVHLDRVESEIETAYLRWEELENMGERG